MWQKIEVKLKKLYPKADTKKLLDEIQKMIRVFQKKDFKSLGYTLSSKDIGLIVYANTLKSRGNKKSPLNTLSRFIADYKLGRYFKLVHILPFYPWDTDRGFSVMNYYEVNSKYGNWGDIKTLSKQIGLMFDFVANHASVKNPLVQKALIANHLPKSDKRYGEFGP